MRPGLRMKISVALIIDQMHNAYMALKLWLNIYLVDVVFSKEPEAKDKLLVPNQQLDTAILVGFLFCSPMVALFFLEAFKIHMDIDGHVQEDLQKKLFRKFLNYSEESRVEVPATIMLKAIQQNAEKLAQGINYVMDLFQVIGQLLVLSCFTLAESPEVWWVVVAMPVLMIIFSMLRMGTTERMRANAASAAKELTVFFTKACDQYPLISDYFQRPMMNDTFAAMCEHVRQANIPDKLAGNSNKYFPKILGPAMVGLSLLWCLTRS